MLTGWTHQILFSLTLFGTLGAILALLTVFGMAMADHSYGFEIDWRGHTMVGVGIIALCLLIAVIFGTGVTVLNHLT